MATIIGSNYYVLAAEQNSYLYPEGSEISAADNYIALQDNITSCPEGEKMSLCLCGCGEETKGGLYKPGHNPRNPHSEEAKEKMRLAQLGKYEEENNPFYGKHHSNEAKEKMKLAKSSDEIREKLRLAKLGNTDWLGKHHSEESKQKIRLGRIGKTHTEEAKEKMKLAKLGNKFALGKKRSEESKKKMAERKIGYVPWIKGKKGLYHHSEEWKKKLALTQLGEDNPNWKGGTSFLPYCSKFNERLKERVRERDGRKCQLCGRTELENGRKLTVHHVHYDKENCYPDLLAVCFRCNSIINSSRDYWEKRCMEILENRGLLNWKPVNLMEPRGREAPIRKGGEDVTVTLLENSTRLGG